MCLETSNRFVFEIYIIKILQRTKYIFACLYSYKICLNYTAFFNGFIWLVDAHRVLLLCQPFLNILVSVWETFTTTTITYDIGQSNSSTLSNIVKRQNSNNFHYNIKCKFIFGSLQNFYYGKFKNAMPIFQVILYLKILCYEIRFFLKPNIRYKLHSSVHASSELSITFCTLAHTRYIELRSTVQIEPVISKVSTLTRWWFGKFWSIVV